ncbi:hypothetical protein REB14_17720 [Chryseobacterium sp. ES2]|uniref:Glycosyltransferase RgtA/B/C/D-like domain-containing protein n=1 Tax=Chryseobacterium metallicongregator TaxID=3073042 RepID=A0ABU1E8N2_9FLAO|nr:hypothetical protein [Chryseobacterium sp. ES2]MDR4954022.1 hypothetical protein [Chryseobacterium sp. ES2]
MSALLNFIRSNRLNGILLFAVYFIINLLFLTKYGIRQSFVPLTILIILFSGGNLLLFSLGKWSWLKKLWTRKSVYLLIVFITIAYIAMCHVMKDPYKMNIDRWATLEFSVQHWVKGEYIYDTPNFMGNLSSYLPGQLLLSSVFYFLGNVGYLQVAIFLLFSCVIFLEFRSNFHRFLAIGMLGISLAYIYEVVCKSDFISSFITVAAFILFWNRMFKDDYFKRPFLLGICIGILCLTRSVVIIPLIIFLLHPFLKTCWKNKIKFGLSFLLTVAILLASVLLPAKSMEHMLQYNPLNLQGQSNKFVMLFFMILSVILSFYVKKIETVFYFSAYILFLLMLSFVSEQYFTLGFSYQNNFFSTTYLAACLPFCIIGYCYTKQRIE